MYLGHVAKNINLSQLVVNLRMLNIPYECRYAMHFVEQEKLHHRYWAHARIDWIIFEFVVLNFVQLVNNVTLVKLALALWLKYLSFSCFNYGFKWYFSLFCMLQKIIYVLLIMLWWVPKWIYMLNFGLVFWFM